MRMIRLTRLKSLGDNPLGLVPESVIRTATRVDWSYAHIRTSTNEETDDIHNDEIHGVDDGDD